MGKEAVIFFLMRLVPAVPQLIGASPVVNRDGHLIGHNTCDGLASRSKGLSPETI